MRREDDIRHPDERIVGSDRLPLEHVEGRTGDPPGTQRLDQGGRSTRPPRLVLTRTAVGRIRLSAAASIRCRVVGSSGAWIDTTSLVRRRVSDRRAARPDSPAPRGSLPTTSKPRASARSRQRAADPAEADDPEPLAGRSPDAPGKPEVPDPALDATVEGDDAAGQRQDEPERMVGDLVRAVVRHVDDARPRARRRSPCRSCRARPRSGRPPELRQGAQDAHR